MIADVFTPWKSSKPSSASHTVSWPSGSCNRATVSVRAGTSRGRTHGAVRHIRAGDVHDARRWAFAESRVLRGALRQDQELKRETKGPTPKASNRTRIACAPKFSATPRANLNGVTGSYCICRSTPSA